MMESSNYLLGAMLGYLKQNVVKADFGIKNTASHSF
jgi:hypothetical protein